MAKELKREGWYAWATEYASIVPGSDTCGQKRGPEFHSIPYRWVRHLISRLRKAFRQASELFTDLRACGIMSWVSEILYCLTFSGLYFILTHGTVTAPRKAP